VFGSDGVDRFVGDRYHIVRELGRGGMGVVYLGRDLRREMDVAIKLRSLVHHDAQRWLKREFRAVSTLRHPNLVELYELVAHERSCYFTMEYLAGVEPRRWVARRTERDLELAEQPTAAAEPILHANMPEPEPVRPLTARPATVPDVDFSRVRSVIAQLAEGLMFLHARGVIHRDVKPSNILVVDGTVKLLDFGLALERENVDEEVSRETRLVGTAAYLAPEYIDHLEVTPALDVYALGVLAFELVTGALPYGGALHMLSKANRTLRLPRASTLNKNVPDDIDQLVAQMLASDPAQRPTALEIATRITGLITQPRAVRRDGRFIGRTGELALLDQRIADPTPRARLVVVTGPSGAGKTALVEEALGHARMHARPPAFVWRGRCQERERVPYRAFDFIIDDLAAELAGDDRIAEGIEHAGALGRVFPALGFVLGAAPPAEDLRVERERALVAMTRLFDRVLGVQRGLVVIDDLQWADDESLELLALLVELVTRPLTIVATLAVDGDLPERVVALLARLEAAAETIALAPMTTGELTALVASVATHASTEQIETAAQLAVGSPYLAELIARELADEGRADPVRPDLRRLSRLSANERAIAELAALATGSTSFEQLRALTGLPSAQLHSALRGLEDERVIRTTPSASGDPVYSFYHERLRDSADSLMTADARRAGHLRFADLLEHDDGPPDQIAYHYDRAGERTHAARWAIAAAVAARAQLAWSIAATWYTRALDLGARDVLADRAECLFLGGKLAAAAADFTALAATGGDRWHVRAAEAYIKLGEIDHGLAVLDGVLARHGQPRAQGRVRSALRTVGVAARWLGRVPSSEPVDDVLSAAYRVIASFLSTPFPLESFEYVLRGIVVAERAGDRDAHSLGMAMLAAYLGVGSLGRFGDRALASAHRLSTSGAPYSRMVAAGAGGILATLRGDWSGMRRAHAQGREICERLGLVRSWEASFLRTYHGLGEYYAGEPAQALVILAELEGASDDLISRAMLGSYRGRALVLAGDLPAAHALERHLLDQPVARRGMAAIYGRVFRAELALAEHDWVRAEAIALELEEAARAQQLSTLPAISAMIDTLLATAELGRRDRTAARRARARAKALYRRGRASFYAPTALRLWAQAERVLGHRDLARALLARAAASADQRGGKVDRLAIAALAGSGWDRSSELAFAVSWSAAGMIEEAT
jgi:hypothetical protein